MSIMFIIGLYLFCFRYTCSYVQDKYNTHPSEYTWLEWLMALLLCWVITPSILGDNLYISLNKK
jgi:cell division protein FtsB